MCETMESMQSEEIHAGEHESSGPFPLRVRSEYYRRNLSKVLTKSENLTAAMSRIERMWDKIEQAQAQMLGRALDDEERRVLRLQTFRDVRACLFALALQIAAEDKASETHVRRTRNFAFVRWRVEKEILILHWRCTMRELELRQIESGLRMPRFLEDRLHAEGLV